MAEFWKSTPKFWCKHCNTYVKDTPFERRQHESTAKHQNNLKRSLRDVQNTHERAERDKQKAKAEVDRLSKLTATGAADAAVQSLTALTPHSFHREKTGPRTADDQKRQWQQLADMGIQVPEHARANMAMVGDWKTQPQSQSQLQQNLAHPTEDPLSVGVRKRKLQDDDDEDKEDISKSSVKIKTKIWGKSIKTLPEDDQGPLDHLLSTSISIKNEHSGTGRILPKREPIIDPVNAPSINDSPGAEIPITSLQDTIDHQNPSPREGAKPVLRSLPGTTANLVKSEVVDEDHQSGFATDATPVSSLVPVFKKRKSKVNSSNS